MVTQAPCSSGVWAELRLRVPARTNGDVLLEAVGPALACGSVSRAFFWRHAQEAAADLSIVSDAEPLAMSLLSADLVGRAGADAAVRSVPAEEQVDVGAALGGPDAAALVSDCLADACGVVLDVVADAVEGTNSLVAAAYDVMLATMVAINRHLYAHERHRDYPTGFMCFRSSADGYLLTCRDPEAAERTFEQAYTRNAQYFCSRLSFYIEDWHRPERTPGDGVGHRWGRLLEPRMPRLLAASHAGRLVDRQHPSGYLGDNYDLSRSEFHQVIQRSSQFQSFMGSDPEFQAMRAALSLMSAVLHQTGLKLHERYALSHCLARATSNVYGVSAAEVLGGLTEVHASAEPAKQRNAEGR